MSTPRRQNRRGLLVFAALGALMLALPRLPIFPPGPSARDETPPPRIEGFRVLRAQGISGRADPFAGLGAPNARAGLPPPRDPVDLCAALFRAPAAAGARRVAYFTDINCPYCRTIERWLFNVSPQDVALTVHDLPLLGPASVAAARAIAAAEPFGRASDLRSRLHRSRAVSDPALLRAVAGGLGIDGEALIAGLQSAEVEARLAETLGLAARLGIPGTPALVIGDLVVIGQIDRRRFEGLLAAYRPPDCT